jgi:TRAP-type C4-dicarboxylate transport system permease large subunit
MNLTDLSLEEMAVAAFPFMITVIICVFLVLLFPDISLLLPWLLVGYGG